jgi:hypothetical protein
VDSAWCSKGIFNIAGIAIDGIVECVGACRLCVSRHCRESTMP